jgi:5'-3' exonuclease
VHARTDCSPLTLCADAYCLCTLQSQRKDTPHELAGQFQLAREAVAAYGIPIFESPGFEADDAIGE